MTFTAVALVRVNERSAGRVVEALEYTTVDDRPLHLDLYLPAGPGPHPVCLWVHGGAWFLGGRADDGQLCAGLAERGIAIASIDYRLGETGAFPASVQDVRSAVRWVRSHGDGYGLAVAKIGAWGASAGGHLSLMAALTPTDGGRDDRIDAVVDCYGPTDLVAGWCGRPWNAPSCPLRRTCGICAPPSRHRI